MSSLKRAIHSLSYLNTHRPMGKKRDKQICSPLGPKKLANFLFCAQHKVRLREKQRQLVAHLSKYNVQGHLLVTPGGAPIENLEIFTPVTTSATMVDIVPDVAKAQKKLIHRLNPDIPTKCLEKDIFSTYTQPIDIAHISLTNEFSDQMANDLVRFLDNNSFGSPAGLSLLVYADPRYATKKFCNIVNLSPYRLGKIMQQWLPAIVGTRFPIIDVSLTDIFTESYSYKKTNEHQSGHHLAMCSIIFDGTHKISPKKKKRTQQECNSLMKSFDVFCKLYLPSQAIHNWTQGMNRYTVNTLISKARRPYRQHEILPNQQYLTIRTAHHFAKYPRISAFDARTQKVYGKTVSEQILGKMYTIQQNSPTLLQHIIERKISFEKAYQQSKKTVVKKK